MTENYKKIINAIYKWHGRADGKVDRPVSVLPECIKERIRYFQPQMENGLSFSGCLNYILVTKDEQQELLDDYYTVSSLDWLPVSDEVMKWHNSQNSVLAEEQVAIALLYGYDGEYYQVKYGDYYFNNQYWLTKDPADYTHFSKGGAEKAITLLEPRYFVKDVRYLHARQGFTYSERIKSNTQIPQKYNSDDYVFLFRVGQQDVGMNSKVLYRAEQPECCHFDEANKILKSIQAIKPEIIDLQKEHRNETN
ncbi:MAG: hypothetical protein J6573_04670 [Lactobacillus sp.]|nr:hypothetical protein [Lactobacillus sp.]